MPEQFVEQACLLSSASSSDYIPVVAMNPRSVTPVPKICESYRPAGAGPGMPYRPLQQPQQQPYQLGPQLQQENLFPCRDLMNRMKQKEKELQAGLLQAAGDNSDLPSEQPKQPESIVVVQAAGNDSDLPCDQAKQTPSIVVEQIKLRKVKGQWVDYWSENNACWIPATIIDVDCETGGVKLDVKPTVALSLRDQKKKVRPRSLPSPEQVSRVNAIVNNGEVPNTAADLFVSVAGRKVGGIARPEDLEELSRKVDGLTGLTGSKVHLKANAAGSQGLTLQRFQELLWELIQIHQEVSVQAIPRSVAESCIEGLPDEKYEIGKQLGKGTYGLVRLATDKKLQQKRAIKIIEKAKCKGNIEFMKVEIQNLIQLDHPHILKLYEFYNSPESLYLVTDHCSGGELYARIVRTRDDRGTIPEVWVAEVMKQLMMAINHIHACGIVHLDLKSQNIMLMPCLETKRHFDRPGEDNGSLFSFLERPHIMVIDLGVATIFQPGNFKGGPPMGTPATMAPEVWRGEITPQADVFSSGCVLFELLSFEMPWTIKYKGSKQQIIDFWSNHPRAAWEKVRYSSQHAQALLQKMLHQERRHRITAPECLSSSFLEQASQQSQNQNGAVQDSREQLIRRLTTVHHRDGLYKSIALMVAKEWPPNQMPSFKRLFTELDVSSTGVLSEQQLAQHLTNLGGVDASAAQRAAAAMNMSQSKAAVDWTEFVAACIDLSKPDFQPAIWQIFKAADKDRDGLLSAKDIEGMLPGGHVYSKEAAKNIFINLTGRWSEDGGARLDWDTFVTHLTKQATAGIPEKAEDPNEVQRRLEQEKKAKFRAKFGIFADMMDAVSHMGPQGQQLVNLLAWTTDDTPAPAPSGTQRVIYPEEAFPANMSQILQKLEEMGFKDKELNQKLVKKHGGLLSDQVIASIISQTEVSPAQAAEDFQE
eukprot:TRINITY_DN103599_c0_g1_i1.p1 TRINITY_DN103599_c0_g1~~TRINITY_DN103599_c0_g1_i1.p1  ORF type:complete len:930 (-),score=176.91 TRINITY_DN103599_c0_g1_i1:81-2870(-)